jgi:hypothetical protein
MPKTSISSRIKKFRKGPLKICPLDSQIQREVVVGTPGSMLNIYELNNEPSFILQLPFPILIILSVLY